MLRKRGIIREGKKKLSGILVLKISCHKLRGGLGGGFWSSDELRSLCCSADPHSGGCFSFEALSQLGKEERPCSGHSSSCGCHFAQLKDQSFEEGLSQISATPNFSSSPMQSS